MISRTYLGDSTYETLHITELCHRVFPISRVRMMVAGYIYKESGGSIGWDFEDVEITLGFSRAGVQ